MSYDPADVLGGAIGCFSKRLFLFVSSVWLGSIIGALSMMAAGFASGKGLDPEATYLVFVAPVLLLNPWLLLNAATVVIGFAYFILSGGAGYRSWMILAALVSVGVNLGGLPAMSSKWLPRLAGWGTWLILLGMLATGVWLLWQHFINRWALHMAAVRAEISVREANADALVRERLAANRPPLPPPGVAVELKR